MLIIIFLIYLLFKSVSGGSGGSVKSPLIVDNLFYNIIKAGPDAGMMFEMTEPTLLSDSIITSMFDKTAAEAEGILKKSIDSKVDVTLVKITESGDKKIKGIIYLAQTLRKNSSSNSNFQHMIMLFFDVEKIDKCNIFEKKKLISTKTSRTIPDYCAVKNFNTFMWSPEESVLADEQTCFAQLDKTFQEARKNLSIPSEDINSNINNSDIVNNIDFVNLGNRAKDKKNVCILQHLKSKAEDCYLAKSKGFFVPGTTFDMLVSPNECPLP